jgi:hypothetical protein
VPPTAIEQSKTQLRTRQERVFFRPQIRVWNYFTSFYAFAY